MKKTILTVLIGAAGIASASDLSHLFTLTDSSSTADLSQAKLGYENSLTFVITLNPLELGQLGDNPYRHDFFKVETGNAGGMGLLYWSDKPQFGITQGTSSTISQATTLLPSFDWSNVGGVALTLTTKENIYTDYIQLHAYIIDLNGNELVNQSYTEKQMGSGYNPTVFGTVYITDLVTRVDGYKGTASPEDALQMAKNAALGLPTIPEPTTATLSLLALAGLAARRRRR